MLSLAWHLRASADSIGQCPASRPRSHVMCIIHRIWGRERKLLQFSSRLIGPMFDPGLVGEIFSQLLKSVPLLTNSSLGEGQRQRGEHCSASMARDIGHVAGPSGSAHHQVLWDVKVSICGTKVKTPWDAAHSGSQTSQCNQV